jgi:hypothetical protein
LYYQHKKEAYISCSDFLHVGLQYTVKNLKFVLTLEPENEKARQKFEWAQKQREANLPTIPSTIGDEFETNTFMRVDLPEIQVNLLTSYLSSLQYYVCSASSMCTEMDNIMTMKCD